MCFQRPFFPCATLRADGSLPGGEFQATLLGDRLKGLPIASALTDRRLVATYQFLISMKK